MSAMMVVFISDSYRPYVSGVVRSVAITARELVARGHRVVIIAPAYPQAPASGADESGAHVVRLTSVPAPGLPNFRIPVPVALSSLAAAGAGAHVIHAHSPFVAGRLALWMARRLGRPVVFTHHTLYHEYSHYSLLPRRAVTPWLLRRVGGFCRRVDHVIAPSRPVQEFIQAVYRVRTPVTVVPTGIDLEPFRRPRGESARAALGIPDEVPVLLYVGRLAREKNVEGLLAAFGFILQALPRAHGVMVGGGPLEAAVRRRAHALAPDGRLHVVGPADPDRVPAYYAAADVFLTASTTETQGLVAAEAMAAGLPVVAPDAAGLKEAVDSGQSGFLTDPDPESLGRAALRLLSDPALRRRMGQNARERATRYDVCRTVDRLLAVYEQAIAFNPWRPAAVAPPAP